MDCHSMLDTMRVFEDLPGVSIIVKFGQYLYSILTTISLAQNCCSRSSRAFSFSMYSCVQRLCKVLRCTTHAALAESTPRMLFSF